MNLTAEELASLPPDLQEAMTLASDNAEALAVLMVEAVYLRAWSQEKRDQLKKGEIKGEFAGPGESFPIASPEDVSAAASSLGRAKGDTDTIKANIIRIAKKFGWESGLPEAWKEKEPAKNVAIFASGVLDDLLESVTDEQGAGLTKWIPVCYPGRWNGLDFTADMIHQMAETFNPKAESCPVKVGHEGDDTQPELSQIKEVKVAPCTLTNGQTVDTCLWVRMTRTPEALASQRRYRKTSIEAWPPQHDSNPTKGKWNLKGLAFLGSAAPAVPNLPPTNLSANTDTGGTHMPELEITEAQMKALKDQQTALTSSLANANNEALRLKSELAEAEAKLAATQKETKAAQIKNELAQFSDKLVPAQMQLLEPVFLALDSDEPTVKLASMANPISPRSCLIAFFQGYKDHGLTNPLDVPRLSGKKHGEVSEDDMDDAAFAHKKTQEFKDKFPDKPTTEAIKYGQNCVKERAKLRAKK